uniref:Uncharacterized protein n=1 Tax=viral metagenome TaxID=1070528 RepID=A0A6C0JEV8_9ZZZZ
MVYKYIVNPQTGRKCRTDTRLGKNIIKNYNQSAGACENCNRLESELKKWKSRAAFLNAQLQECWANETNQ